MNSKQLKVLAYFLLSFQREFLYNPLGFVRGLIWYFQDLWKYHRLGGNPAQSLKLSDLYPILADKTKNTPLEPIYYFQDTWAAGRVFLHKPKKHTDVASHATTVGILSQFVPTTFIDIRPIELELPNLHFQKGSILSLPFADKSVESLSSLCVVEHIGLGRYGDEIDPFGSEKSLRELGRVIKKNGHLYISVPVQSENMVYFNAHRAFSPQYIKSFFPDFEVQDEKYIYGKKLMKRFDPKKGFGVMLLDLQRKRS